MKKIYSKITKERRKQFQIETYIMKDGEQRLVVKRALAKDGVAHIRKMSDYYEKNKDEGILCPSKLISENEIAFEFLTGESLCNTMLEALEDKDEVRFLSLLRMYDGIIRSNVNIERRTFMPDAQFVQVFGEVSFPDEMECGKEMNIDMSFDNIIKDQTDSKYKIIDYEWVFSFPIPVKFVIYRAVSAFYTRNGSAMKDIMTINEIYDCFDITEEEIVIFENMNEAFNQYVYGGKNGYNASLIAYKKEVYDVKKLLPEENLFFFSTKSPRRHTDVSYPDNCYLFFGKETKGLPEDLLHDHPQAAVRIPMISEARSLNLSNAVAIGVYEALRQWNYPTLQSEGHLRDYDWDL